MTVMRGALLLATLLAGCATAAPYDSRALPLELACAASQVSDPFGLVSAALCGASVVQYGVLWLIDRPLDRPEALREIAERPIDAE